MVDLPPGHPVPYRLGSAHEVGRRQRAEPSRSCDVSVQRSHRAGEPMHIRATLAVLVICGTAAPAGAQNNTSHVPNSVPLSTERARSYSLLNQSDRTIVSAHARMTNGDERD